MKIQYSTEDCCSICYEPYKDSTEHDTFRLKCQHAFGRSCIKRWATKSTICPACGLDTFPAELSGGLNIFRRLADRTVFAPDPPAAIDIGIGCGFSIGVVGGIIAGPAVVISTSAAKSVILSGVVAGVGAFRGMTLGNEGVISCSYFLGASAALLMSALII